MKIDIKKLLYVQQNNQTFRPINAYFMDAAQKQLALVVYGVNNE